MAVSIKIVFGQKENMNKSPDPLLNICKYDRPLKINVENFYPEKKIFDNFTFNNTIYNSKQLISKLLPPVNFNKKAGFYNPDYVDFIKYNLKYTLL